MINTDSTKMFEDFIYRLLAQKLSPLFCEGVALASVQGFHQTIDALAVEIIREIQQDLGDRLEAEKALKRSEGAAAEARNLAAAARGDQQELARNYQQLTKLASDRFDKIGRLEEERNQRDQQIDDLARQLTEARQQIERLTPKDKQDPFVTLTSSVVNQTKAALDQRLDKKKR